MKHLNISSLCHSVTFFITVAIAVLVVLITVIITVIQNITNEGIFLDSVMWVIISIIGLTLSLLSWLIYKKIYIFEKRYLQQKELESKLIESKQIYTDFFEYTKSANIIYTTDDNAKSFKIKWLNASVEKLENVKREDIIGKNLTDVFKGAEEFGIVNILREVYLSGKPQIMPISVYRDGSCETWRENYIFKLGNGDIVASYDDGSKEKKVQLLMNNVINSADNLIFVKDTKFRYILCNKAFEDFLGKSFEEIKGKSDYDIFDKDTADFFRFNDKEMLESKTVHENYEWISDANGNKHYLLTIKSPLKDEEGNIIGLVGNSVDVTNKKNLQDELTEAKEQFDQLMKYIPANIYIIEDKSIVYSNKSACDFFAKETLVDFKIDDLLSKDEAKIINSGFDKALKNRVFEDVVEMSNYLNEKRLFRILVFTIGNAKVNKFGLVSMDITEQYKDQHDIAKFKEIIEKSPISIAITDVDGNLEYVNSWFTKVTGYTYQEAIGQNPRILKSDFHSEEDYKELWNEITHNHVWSGIFKNIKKNGDEYWESAIIAPLRNSDGKITNFIGIKQEITEQIYLKRELKNKEDIMIAQSRHAAMGEMIGMIAHQWRQPISVIAMGANNILVDIELEEIDEKAFKDQAESILKQTEYLSKTIDDFRNFFRPDKEIEEVKIEDIIEDARKIIGKSLENNAITLNITYDESYTIKTYSRELLQVYINLLKNSKEALVEYRDENRYINISVSSDKNFIITTVCDNGGGIDEKIIGKIFDPYFSTKDEKTGTGLGLYMSKTIIDKHLYGNISVKNSNDGACFSVKIPKMDKNA